MIGRLRDFLAAVPRGLRRLTSRRAHPLDTTLAGATLLAVLGGCETALDRHRADIRRLSLEGRYDVIVERLDDPKERKLYAQRDELLWFLDRGAAAQAVGDADGAVFFLSEAEDRMDERRREDPAESLAVIVINDKLGPYLGEPYEDIYVNVLKMLAQMEAGRLAGGATVEVRRMAQKVDLLREEHLRLVAAAKEELPDSIEERATDDSGAPAPPRAVAEEGEFIESPLGTFLTAVVFMHTGDPSNQAVAARRLIQAIEAQGELIGPVDPAPFRALETLTPADANVLVVALAGQSPMLVPFRAPPLIINNTPIYFELPILRTVPSDAVQARVIVESPGREPRIAPLHLVEEMASVADHNHRRALPAIYLRTLLRAAAKSVGLTFANEAMQRSTNNDAAQAGVAIASLLLLVYTEQADTRCWTLLPGRAFAGLLDLAPGETTITLEYVDGSGSVIYRTEPRTFDPADASLTTFVGRYWR